MSIKWKPKADGYFFKKFLGNLESKKKLEDEDLKVRGSKNIVKYIKENKEFISLMKKLVEMKEDLELGVALKNFKKKYEDQNKLSNKMKSLGMKH